jgi:hypothetical protein
MGGPRRTQPGCSWPMRSRLGRCLRFQGGASGTGRDASRSIGARPRPAPSPLCALRHAEAREGRSLVGEPLSRPRGRSRSTDDHRTSWWRLRRGRQSRSGRGYCRQPGGGRQGKRKSSHGASLLVRSLGDVVRRLEQRPRTSVKGTAGSENQQIAPVSADATLADAALGARPASVPTPCLPATNPARRARWLVHRPILHVGGPLNFP